MNKKAIFFSIDALVALSILMVVMLSLYPLLKSTTLPENNVPADILSTLSTISMGELNNSYARSLIAQGFINETNVSVLEGIGKLYVSDVPKARSLAQSILNNLTPQQNVGIWYGSTLIASYNTTPYDNATIIEVARQTITGIQEGESVTGYSAKAFLKSSLRSKYFYFGGYVGDGNISIRLEYMGNITAAEMELAINNNFTLVINNQSDGSYTKSTSDFIPSQYTLPTNLFASGNNTVVIQGKSLYITGGYLKITYQSDVEYSQPNRQYLPGIAGVVNLYDGLHIPGQLVNLSIFLHYRSNYTAFLRLGNTTVFNGSSAGETYVTLNNSYLSSLLNYNMLSNKTSPLRMGIQEVLLNGSGGNADVILITDTSSSMNWDLDSDDPGVTRACNNALINDPTTSRISLAKCIDIDFIKTILSGSGNRIGLVSFSSSANNYVNLTNNQTLLNSTITAYATSGGTCVACAINRAYTILQQQSNSTSRRQFVVVMTDGVTNTRSTATCTNFYGAATPNVSNPYAIGSSGSIFQQNLSKEWMDILAPTSNQINDLDILNSTLGFGVGSAGSIISWNGATWSTTTTPTANALYSLDIYNTTFGLAVGASGTVLRWNGTSWSALTAIANSPTVYSVSILNRSFALAVGVRSNRGRIYQSIDSGATWTETTTGSANTQYNGVKVLNSSLAYVVGNDGEIFRWNGATWSSVTSGTTEDLYSVDAFNATYVFAAGGNDGAARIVRSVGGSFSSVYSDGSADSIREVIVANFTTTYTIGEGATVVTHNGTGWGHNFEIPAAYQGNSSTGISCSADEESCSEPDSFPARNAKYSACRTARDLNATLYSIGFGPVASCSFAQQVLQSVSTCGNGSYFASTNATALAEFYNAIANDILRIAYAEQIAQVTGNVSTILYSDSYIQFDYMQSASPYGLVISTEKQFDTSDYGTVTVPTGTNIIEAQAISYSGPRWTSLVRVNNYTAYNLTIYGTDYAGLGDPYAISLPLTSLNTTTTVTIVTGVAPTNTSTGSTYNKIIYSVLKNASSYTPIVANAQGCNWTIQYEDNSNSSVMIPATYSGLNTCKYQVNNQIYNDQDAYQVAVYRLLQLLDLDSNQKVDVKFSDQNLQIDQSSVTGIPFTWATEVQVRTWY